MGYIINKNGEKIEVKNPDGCCGESVVLINDDTFLDEKWLIEIYKKNIWEKNSQSDFIAEVIMDTEPKDEEIIFHMIKNDVNRYTGYSIIKKIRVLDFAEGYE